jgi:DNA-directed RNA polymerase subunit beta'
VGFDEVEMAYSLGKLKIHDTISFLVNTWYDEEDNRLSKPEQRIIQTTVGRVLFNRILPPELLFINRVLDKGGIKDLVADVYELCGPKVTTEVVDKIKDIGFLYATRSGHSIAISDVIIPKQKQAILNEALQEEREVQRSFRRGLLTEKRT